MGSRASSAERIDVTSASLHALLTRVQPKLATDEYRELQAIIDTLLHLADLLAKKRTSIARLRALLFGACTETTRKVLAKVGLRCVTEHTSPAYEGTRSEARGDKRCTGHGRNGAAAYAGGQQIHVPHPHLKPGDHCPLCAKGKVYDQRDPHVLVRFVAQAPIGAKVTVLETLRCNLCGELFTAPVPDDVGDEKCDASTGAMIALLKYGCGVPFNRLARLQASVEIPLPVSTQWEIVAAVATRLHPMLDELTRQAADGELLHNDDTPMRVLSLLRKETAGTPDLPASPPPALPADSTADDVAPERTGVFTSGIVATCGDHRVALFLTGRHHAGENLATVLAARSPGLPPPIQMCDALPHNVPKDFAGIVANCLAHARRGIVDVTTDFPDECRYVLERLREVYAYDAQTRQQKMSPEDRLVFHQVHSGPVMAALHAWFTTQLEARRVEPNSGLGDAITYFLKHWTKLTRFLTVPGAPLDNTIVERALKRAILHRKSALFFKTLNGAKVGDLFMSAIHTCELNAVNPFAYLVALQQHAGALAATPSAWMPWNYRVTLQQLKEGADTG